MTKSQTAHSISFCLGNASFKKQSVIIVVSMVAAVDSVANICKNTNIYTPALGAAPAPKRPNDLAATAFGL